MKTVNARLITFGLASLLLAACSDNTSDTPNTPGDSQILGSEVISIPQSKLTDRVRNFKAVKTKMTRVAGATSSDLGDAYSMPAKPSVPSNAIEITEKWVSNENPTGAYNLTSGKSYVIKKGTKINSSLNLNGATLYVEGELNVDNCWGNGYWDGSKNKTGHYNVYILGGKISFNYDVSGGFSKNTGLALYNYGGTVTSNTGSTFYVGKDEAFYTDTDFDLSNRTLKVQGIFYAGGKVTAADFISEKGGTTNIQGGFAGLDDKDLAIEGTVNINGNLSVKNLTIKGDDGKLYLCSANVKEKFLLNSNNAQSHISYIKAKTVQQDATSTIYLVDNSVIECDEFINTRNAANSANVTLEGDNATAVIKTKRIQFNGSKGGDNVFNCYLFNSTGAGSQILLDCPRYDYYGDNTGTNMSFDDVTWHGGVDNGVAAFKGGELALNPAECGYTIVPKDDPTPDPDPVVPDKILDPVGEVDYDHTHNISATCIQPYNGKMYMSYHTRGKGHGACIEVFETDAQKQTKMLQYLQDKEQNLDFNHLMVDSKPATPLLYVVGNSFKKGAILARIDINKDGLLNTDEKVIDENTTIMPLTVVALDKNAKKEDPQDENCIVRDGDKLLVMSTRGYEVYDTDLNLLGSKKTAGKAKHIAINGNNMATLYYDGPVADTIQANGVIEEFTTGSDILTATPTKTIAVGRIAPNNGKNTIAIDGNNLYVCRGSEGLTCFDRTTGNAKWTWKAPLTADTKVVQGNANGVTFDDNYIYLACGGYGVVVLDKNTMVEGKPKVIAKKRAEKRNSANYVTLNNGLVYVAYGKSRLQVFQLIDKPTKVKY